MRFSSRAFLYTVLIVLCTILGSASASSIDISAVGSYAEFISDMDLIGGPGSDLEPEYESASNEVTIFIENTTDSSDSWRVEVRKADTTWHGDMRLFVRRTADGTGNGSISGGSAYLEVTAVDKIFFSGSGDRDNIEIQLKITGMSVAVPIDSYATTLTYSLIDL